MWELIQRFAAQDEHYIGISQSRNRAIKLLLAGLMEALHSGTCDVTISIDCDGQDDINAMDEMVKKHSGRCRGLRACAAAAIQTPLQALHRRGLLPCDERSGRRHRVQPRRLPPHQHPCAGKLCRLQGSEHFPARGTWCRWLASKSEVVTYERHERLAGESHYPLSKMLALAFDGDYRSSNKPIRLITGSGIFVSLISFIGVIWAIIEGYGQRGGRLGLHYLHRLFVGGVQLVCLGA